MDSTLCQYHARMQVNEAEEELFFGSMDFTQDEPKNINKKFPFEDYTSEKYFDFLFPNSYMNQSTNNVNQIEEQEDVPMIDKLTNSIDNYNNILLSEFSSKFPSKFEENLKLAENTLPGNIIKLMVDSRGPITFDKILYNLEYKMNNFRKANGSKYGGDAKNSILSTLKTSNIFFKTGVNTYYFKEKEAYEFIYRNYEREVKKKIKRSKNENKSTSRKSLNNSKSNIKKSDSLQPNLITKIQKINSILEKMVKKFRGEPKYENLIKIMNKKNQTSLETLKECCEKDKFIGMLMCLKYSKNLIETYIKYVGRKKNIDIFFDLQGINEKIFKICDKFEKWELNLEKNENFPFNGNNDLNNSKSLLGIMDHQEERTFLDDFSLDDFPLKDVSLNEFHLFDFDDFQNNKILDTNNKND